MPVFVRVLVYYCSEGNVSNTALLCKCDTDTLVYDILKDVATQLHTTPDKVSLWLPHKFLATSGAEDLRERLEQNDRTLSKFSDGLLERDEELMDSVLLPPSGSSLNRNRNVKYTALIAAVDHSRRKRRRSESEEAEGDALSSLQRGYKRVLDQLTLSPSVNTQPPHYYRYQSGATPILDGRYSDKVNPPALPIELYHPAFANFRAVAENSSITPPMDVIQATKNLMMAASQIHTAEATRQQSTRALLSELLSHGMTQTVNLDRSSADHSITVGRTEQPLGCASCTIVEEKPEFGTGGDSSVQGCFSYQSACIQNQSIAAVSFCPSFVVALAGPWIVIMGAIFTSHIIAQRLTDFIWLGQSRAIDDDRAVHLARIFYALRLGVQRLVEYYQQPLCSPTAKQDRFFPLATSYLDRDNTLVEFRYRSPLQNNPSCAAFLVQRKDSNEYLVVKFVERYGEDAHKLLAAHKFAPQLLYCGPVWGTGDERNGCGPRKMVVMEHVKGSTVAAKYAQETVPENVGVAVQAAVELLHSQDLVHGDLRRPNILIPDEDSTGGHRAAVVVDFDWSGKAGEVCYPLNLSTSVTWPTGVKECGAITKQHDLDMVDLLRRTF